MNDAATTFHPSVRRMISDRTDACPATRRDQCRSYRVSIGKRLGINRLTMALSDTAHLQSHQLARSLPSLPAAQSSLPHHRSQVFPYRNTVSVDYLAKSTDPKQWLTRTSVPPIQAHPSENLHSYRTKDNHQDLGHLGHNQYLVLF